MKLATKTIVIIALTTGLSACAGMSHKDKDTAIGAGAGALVGGALTGGSAAGVVGGAVVGGVIGHEVGEDKDHHR
jgi:osmotically inducible lipoprotein OsmB